MFDEIIQNDELYGLIKSECSENRIFVEFDEQLEKDDDKYIILKTDQYYNTIDFATPPPSVDCLIIVKCSSNQGYDFYLIELKNIKSKSGFDIENIRKKFETVIEDFLKTRFSDIFLNNSYNVNNLYLFFVSDPYKLGNITQKEYDIKIKTRGLKLKTFQLIKPFKFKGKRAEIKPSLPHLIRITPC